MRRTALISLLALLAFAAAALAAGGSASLTVNPKEAGKGSVATIDAKPPRKDENPSSVALRVSKGVKVDPKAVARRCRPAQAQQNSCPAASRIGGGKADLTVTPGGPVTADIDLYLAPKQRAGDIAAVVAIAVAAGQTAHTTGRIFRLDTDKYPKLGLQTSFDNLRSAFKPPEGFKVHVDHLNLHFGKHRTVDGKRHDLIRNPSTCGAKGWPWHVEVGYPTNGHYFFHGSVDCSPAPTP
jgi:hypothetical protein